MIDRYAVISESGMMQRPAKSDSTSHALNYDLASCDAIVDIESSLFLRVHCAASFPGLFKMAIKREHKF